MKTSLETLFDRITWERKFEYEIPSSMISRVFRKEDISAAVKYFSTHKEETQKQCRAVYLFDDSLGQALAVTQEVWE